MNLNVQELRQGSRLPLVVRPVESGHRWTDLVPDLRALVDEHLLECGASCFEAFASTAPAISGPSRPASSPAHQLRVRFHAASKVADGVYTSTEYPPHQRIPLHNEQAYTREWPMKLWFFCEVSAKEGGETPIADSRAIYRRIDLASASGSSATGSCTCATSATASTCPGSRCSTWKIAPAWSAIARGGASFASGRTTASCARARSVRPWPRTLAPARWSGSTRLTSFTSRASIPRCARRCSTRWMSPICRATSITATARPRGRPPRRDPGRARRDADQLPWSAGDVLMLDNMLTAHGRSPFRGPRKVIVAMAEGRST